MSRFVSAVEKMERFIAKQMSLDGGVCLMKELGVKGVKEFTLFDIVLDFMLFDSFDDLKCPPQAVLNALQTTWVPSSVRKRVLHSINSMLSQAYRVFQLGFERGCVGLCTIAALYDAS